MSALFAETRKIFFRRRTWMALAVFAGIELLMAALCRLPRVQESLRALIESRTHSFEDYFSGLTVALLIMRTTVFFIGTLFLALIAGEIVAKEVEDGSLRMLLCRPVTRLRMLARKFFAIACYTVVLAIFSGVTALGIGFAVAGSGDFFAFGFQDHVSTFLPFDRGLLRYLTVLPLLAVSLLSVSSFAFMCSCFDLKPATATIGTLTLFFTDVVLRGVPFFSNVRSWFVTERMSAWMQLFQPTIPWFRIAEDYAVLLALDVSFLVVGWAVFELRDLKR